MLKGGEQHNFSNRVQQHLICYGLLGGLNEIRDMNKVLSIMLHARGPLLNASHC